MHNLRSVAMVVLLVATLAGCGMLFPPSCEDTKAQWGPGLLTQADALDLGPTNLVCDSTTGTPWATVSLSKDVTEREIFAAAKRAGWSGPVTDDIEAVFEKEHDGTEYLFIVTFFLNGEVGADVQLAEDMS